MKKFLLLVILVAGQLAFAQNAKLIIGKWAYAGMQTDGEADEQGQQMMDMLFKDLTISFRTDNTLTLQMRKKPEPGTYSFDPSDDKIINAISEKGTPMTMKIVKLTKDEMTLTLGDAGTMNLKKTSDTPDAAPAPIPVTPKVAATQKQISGKWYVVGKEEQQSELAAELLKNSFVEFATDGTYNAKILSVEQSGTWELGQGNTTINVDLGEDGHGVWSIYKITADELIMQNDTSALKMIFRRKV